MNRKEREEVFKAINGVANRVNDVSQKLDEVMHMLNANANEKITVNSGGIDGLGDHHCTVLFEPEDQSGRAEGICRDADDRGLFQCA